MPIYGGNGQKLEELDPIAVFQEILGEPGRRQGAHGKFKFTCPSCGREGHLDVCLHPEAGALYTCCTDNNGCIKGNLRRFLKEYAGWSREDFAGRRVKRVDLPVEKPIDWDLLTRVYGTAYQACSLMPAHREYLQERGIDPEGFFSTDGMIQILRQNGITNEEIAAAGLIWRRTPEQPWRPSMVAEAGRIAIPYFDPEAPAVTEGARRVVYLRSRFMGPYPPKNKRYQAPYGISSNPMVYGMDKIPEGFRYLVVTEGELKARAAQQVQVPMVARPGITVPIQRIITLCKQRGIRRIFLLDDTSIEPAPEPGRPTPQERADFYGRKAVDLARGQGLEAYIARLPSLGEPKMDVDTFILRRPDTAASDILQILNRALLDLPPIELAAHVPLLPRAGQGSP